MYMLFGKKNIRFFDFEKQNYFTVSYEEFHEIYSESEMDCFKIIDRPDIDFTLEHLKNCSAIDTYKILRCRMKMLKSHENISLILSDHFNLFRKNNFYIQKNTIDNPDFYKGLDLSNGVFLIENVICEFCKSISKIEDYTWWLYIGEHQSSGIRFVAGIGNGIVFSRIIEQINDFQEDIEFHILKTLQYIKRFGFKNQIKIISAINNFVIDNESIELIDLKKNFSKNRMQNTSDIEYILIDFLCKNENIKKAFITENFLMYFLKNHINKIFIFLLSCFIVLGFCIFNIQSQIYDLKNFMIQNEKNLSSTAQDLSKTFEAKIDVNNFKYIQCVTKFLKESKNPIDIIKKISPILQKYKIQILTLSIEGSKNIKCKCKLNKEKFEKMQQLSNEEIEINITKIENQKNDYEIIDDDEDKNFGADICIKLK